MKQPNDADKENIWDYAFSKPQDISRGYRVAEQWKNEHGIVNKLGKCNEVNIGKNLNATQRYSARKVKTTVI